MKKDTQRFFFPFFFFVPFAIINIIGFIILMIRSLRYRSSIYSDADLPPARMTYSPSRCLYLEYKSNETEREAGPSRKRFADTLLPASSAGVRIAQPASRFFTWTSQSDPWPCGQTQRESPSSKDLRLPGPRPPPYPAKKIDRYRYPQSGNDHRCLPGSYHRPL